MKKKYNLYIEELSFPRNSQGALNKTIQTTVRCDKVGRKRDYSEEKYAVLRKKRL